MYKKLTAMFSTVVGLVACVVMFASPAQATPRDDALAAIQAARAQVNANSAYLPPQSISAYNMAFAAWTAAVNNAFGSRPGGGAVIDF